MKKKIVKLFCLLLLLGVFVSVQPAAATTIWEPTDSGEIDVNFIGASTFAIFDDSHTEFSGFKLELSTGADTIFFTQSGSNWNLSSAVSGDSLVLSDSNYFTLAAFDTTNSKWIGNAGYTYSGAHGMYIIDWVVQDMPVIMTGIDLQPVPIPASALLLVSGLIGLVGLRSKFRK